jgi:hypothetical protein
MNKCTVRVRDSHGSEHCAIVYAESLYEAAIRGLNMLEHVGWESDRDETIKSVEVEVHHEPTRHTVDVPRLLSWVQDTAMSMSPAQDTRKAKLRKLLGIKKVERTRH